MSIEQRHDPGKGPPPTVQQGHEPYQTNVLAVLLLAGAVGGAIVLVLLVGIGLYAFFGHRAESRDVAPPPVAVERRPPPQPRLRVAPARDLAQLREQEQTRLETFGWVDRRRGVVHVPIEHALQLIAAEHGHAPPREDQP